jgi:RimJ/RimL family protein N-acetyltransferase
MPYTLKTDPQTGRFDVTLESENFLVRTATLDDVNERWAGWLNDPVAAMMLNARPRTFTLDELRDYVRSFDQIDRILAVVLDRKTGDLIGISILEFLPGRRKVRPSVLIGEPEFRNMGLLHEMEQIAYETYFDGFKVDAVVSNVLAHNSIAIAFNESRGWKLTQRLVGAKRSSRTGEPLDVLVYEITRDMWLARKSAGQQA